MNCLLRCGSIKESMGILPSFSNEVIQSSDQTSREAVEGSFPCYICRVYKLTKYFTTKCLCRQSFATLRLTPFQPIFPSIDTTDIPVLAQTTRMLPVQRYFLYTVLLILLKNRLTFCMTGPLLLLLLRWLDNGKTWPDGLGRSAHSVVTVFTAFAVWKGAE